MAGRKCTENCNSEKAGIKNSEVPADPVEMTLADLPVGSTATIVKIMPKLRGRKKFADIGLIPGSELLIESHAPFGGLIRVKVMETSMALHRDDASNIVIREDSGKSKKEGRSAKK